MEAIERKFKDMGARIKFNAPLSNRWRSQSDDFTIDVARDSDGEFFSIRSADRVDFQVLDIDKKDRHLLLMATINNEDSFSPEKIKILCGHDEREWFTSQVDRSSVNIDTAKQALKPNEVVEAQLQKNVKTKSKHKRKNKGYIRQGEWFFLPEEHLEVDEKVIHKKEPLEMSNSRGGSKPHIAEEAYRVGGEAVYVSHGFLFREELDKIPTNLRNWRSGLTEGEKKALIKIHPKATNWGWQLMIRNPTLYVRGTIRHPDHKTLKLKTWCKVVVNQEIRGQNSVFLD